MAEEENSNKGKGGKGKIIIIILVVLLLLIIAAVAFFLLSSGEEEIPEAAKPITEVAEPLQVPIFLSLDDFLVNLKGGRRYLKVKIQLMMSEPPAVNYLTLRKVEVRDMVLTELQELSVEDVNQSSAREALKQRLISAISSLFPSKPEWEDPNPLKKILFEEFVIQ